MDLSNFGFREDFDLDNRIVKQEEIEFEGKMYRVSTVDLGIDHQSGEGNPLYFETMIFPKSDNFTEAWRDLYCDRYTDRESALNGHEKLIAEISNGKYEIVDGYFELID